MARRNPQSVWGDMGKELLKRLMKSGVPREVAQQRVAAATNAIRRSLDDVNKVQWEYLYSSGAAKKAAKQKLAQTERQAMGRFAERAMAGGRNAPESLRRIRPSEFANRARVGGYEEASIQRAAERALEAAKRARGKRSGAARVAQARFTKIERATDIKARGRMAKSRAATESWSKRGGKK